jgi:hypothetical protein
LPTSADKEAFEALKASPPSVETHPHTFAWFCLVSKFQDSVKSTWAAPAKAAEKKPAAPKKEAVKEEAKPAATTAAADDDDELDLFGDGPSEVSFLS